MEPQGKLLEKHWNWIAKELLPTTASESQRDVMKVCFYAGAYSFLLGCSEGMKQFPGDGSGREEVVEKLYVEILETIKSLTDIVPRG
jgi:hypothetical protein